VKPFRLLAAALVLSGCASGGSLGPKVPAPGIDRQPAGAAVECGALAESLERWRQRLGLRDWGVSFHCEPPPGEAENIVGMIQPFFEERTAEVWIRPDVLEPENVVVHELLHLIFGQSCYDSGELIEEQQLRVLVRLLLAAN